MKSEECLVVNLDGMDSKEALSFVKKYSDHLWGVKIGSGIYCEDASIHALCEIVRVIADVKLFDDPYVMAQTAGVLIGEGVSIITVHCVADWDPGEEFREHLCAVPLLPSVGGKNRALMMSTTINEIILEDARRAAGRGYKYLMCSGKVLREIVAPPLPNMIKICDRVRPRWTFAAADTDAYRAHYTTPEQAMSRADLIIVGEWVPGLVAFEKGVHFTIEEINSIPNETPEPIREGDEIAPGVTVTSIVSSRLG